MDKSMLGDLDSLPEEDKVKMGAMIEQLQIRDRVLSGFCRVGDGLHSKSFFDDAQISDVENAVFLGVIYLRMYNTLVERCFNDCVDSFRRKSLDKQEETCVRRCAEKFLKHSMRVGMRFAELNQGAATPD
ncbi:hypothetical protein Syun_002626 [Stephania yunnanensis]|uniref:Mitochondrial import inner membrane translocase subunit n=1 Tax=Stephania yunnanensis TaxID=152371 RepID=A0AAP0QC07_9MAGN